MKHLRIDLSRIEGGILFQASEWVDGDERRLGNIVELTASEAVAFAKQLLDIYERQNREQQV